MTQNNAIRCLLIIAVCIMSSASALAAGTQQIDFLKQQQDALGGTLLDNLAADGMLRAYTYDQALAVIAFTRAGETARARAVLDTMRTLVGPDGAPGCWRFGYNYDELTGAFSPVEETMYAGANAWMLVALNYYQMKTFDASYADLAALQAQRMEALRVTDPLDERCGAYRLRGTFDGVNWIIHPAVSTEHQHDMYSALKNRGLMGDPSLITKADEVRDYLAREAWAPSPTSNFGHDEYLFWRGINDDAIATDCMSWAILSEGPLGPNGEPYYLGLDWLLGDPDATRNVQDYIAGFIEDVEGFSAGHEPGETPHPSVWPEGTEGVVAALRVAADYLDTIGETAKAQQYRDLADYFHYQDARLISDGGGIVYSFSEVDPGVFQDPDNIRYDSVASTAWYYFNENGVNPLQVVPEPATLAMAAFGLLATAIARLRNRGENH